MPTYKSISEIQNSIDVQITQPLDIRLVVDRKEDLTKIKAPYKGMCVSIAGTSEIWIFIKGSIEESRNLENWKLVSGNGSGLSKYSLPVMTPEMVDVADSDSDIDFDSSEDSYLLIDDGTSLNGKTDTNTITSVNGTYLDIMMRTIRSLQMEIARLKNSFEYGITSYTDEKTAKSRVLDSYGSVDEKEPLWAVDPAGLSLVSDSTSFNTYLGPNNSFTPIGEGTIDVSIDDRLGFDNCTGWFYDGRLNESGERTDFTLRELSDSKQVIYLVTDKPGIELVFQKLGNTSDADELRIDCSKLIGDNTVDKYGFCIIVSRKVIDDKTKEEHGFNYIYFSIINFITNDKLKEGYYNVRTDSLTAVRTLLDDRYSIYGLGFRDMILYRMKFYTKYEDFSDEVIPSAPNEYDYKLSAAHITIRSVKNTEMLERMQDQLLDNELVWNQASGTLHIKTEGKIKKIGSNTGDNDNKDDNMTDKEIIAALTKMGIVVNVKYKTDASGNETDEIESVDDMKLNAISEFSFINPDTGKKFTFNVDSEGNLVGKDASIKTIQDITGIPETYDPSSPYKAVRGFSSEFLCSVKGSSTVNDQSDLGMRSDRLRISSFYAPISGEKTHGCTHSFVELENSSDTDIPLKGVYLHYYVPDHDDDGTHVNGKVYHLALDGVISAGGTYLVRGAKHAEYDDESAFIKVRTYDKEWFDGGKIVSFEQIRVKTVKSGSTETIADDSPIKAAYRFCLTYGLPDLKYDDELVQQSTGGIFTIDNKSYNTSDYPTVIVNPRFIDSCSFSTFTELAKKAYRENGNSWYANGSSGQGITIVDNSMFRLMFELDPAKQAFNGFNMKDGSRVRYNKDTDLQVLRLDKAYIGFPHSSEVISIDRYTPKASFEKRNVMTDKTQLDRERPNMVTCSFGIDVYNTRCFNWISCGVFDECLWIHRKGHVDDKGNDIWSSFKSYTEISEDNPEKSDTMPYRKEYPVAVNNAVYARIINRFPGNNVLFAAHKCVIVLPDAESEPVEYEYVVGRPDKDGNPDPEHTNERYTFTLYPRTYEGKVYQITDQQGFHWIEYQVWAASAEFLNGKIAEEVAAYNKAHSVKIFPILINTGDMTQSGARINEWLDYYNGGKSLFSHMEQMNVVGNNDLCDVDPNILGTGNDSGKSNSRFFHYFYCYDLKDSDRYGKCMESDDDSVKARAEFFSGESMVIKASGNITEDRYIPSTYYFRTKNVMYLMVNSEIPETGVRKWFGLDSNIYTGIKFQDDGRGDYDTMTRSFTPVYETLYAWLYDNAHGIDGDEMATGDGKRIVVAMHEMPFTVITKESLGTKDKTNLACTRNHPTNGSRVGSNLNQLNIKEKNGNYWCSRLLEYFGCKIVIGGHKHTYALSYPIKEYYTWTDRDGVTKFSGGKENGKYNIKPMSWTLEDESGVNPKYVIDWTVATDSLVEYNITDGYSLNSTKTPLIPQSLYDTYAAGVSFTGIFRCCTPTTPLNDKNDGFIVYSMCQATGYKLKSNKELPSASQVFSQIIPETNVTNDTSSPNGNQLYPMYSTLTFNDDCSELDIRMIRITGIFAKDGKDSFTQISYGTGKSIGIEYLCSYVNGTPTRMYGAWIKSTELKSDDKYSQIKF